MGKEPYDIVKVIGGGRITIPNSIRKLLKIEDGDHLAVYYKSEDNSINYVPVEFVTRNGRKLEFSGT